MLGESRWLSVFDEPSLYSFKNFLNPAAYRAEVRLTPEERSFVATDFGVLDYSLALLPSLRLQLPLGLAAYGTYEVPVSNTEEFENGKAYAFFRHKGGWRERKLQWAYHPLPGLIGLSAIGKSQVYDIPFNVISNELVWDVLDGRNQFRYLNAQYKPENSIRYSSTNVQLWSYRFWWIKAQTALEFTYGHYFYQDRGFKAELRRYFGDTVVAIFVREDLDNKQKLAGITLSLPLTPRQAPSLGPVTITGTPRFSTTRATVFGESANLIRPFFLYEPPTQYDLRRDLMDSDRLIPANPYVH